MTAATLHFRPLPFNVITGFLGAGKTTLLNRLLDDPGMEGTLVVINEFGEAGLDHLLVETSTEEVLELSSGCLCCALRGDLVDLLVRVMSRRERGEMFPFRRIVVETSGLADPAPVLHAVMAHPWLLERLRLDGVVTVVDALLGLRTLERHPEPRKQVAVADRIVLAKTEMAEADGEAVERLERVLREINSLAPILRADRDVLNRETLFNAGLVDETGKPAAARWLDPGGGGDDTGSHAGTEETHGEGGRHGNGYGSLVMTTETALRPEALDIFVDLLRTGLGPALLRFKGIVKLEDDPSRPVVLHGIQHVFHPPVRLAAWPEGMDRTRMIFVTQGDVHGQIRKLFSAVVDPLAGSGAALADRTLSLLSRGDG